MFWCVKFRGDVTALQVLRRPVISSDALLLKSLHGQHIDPPILHFHQTLPVRIVILPFPTDLEQHTACECSFPRARRSHNHKRSLLRPHWDFRGGFVRSNGAVLRKYILMLDGFWLDVKARVRIGVLLRTLACHGGNLEMVMGGR